MMKRFIKKRSLGCALFVFLALSSLGAVCAFADVIIDNGGPGTSSTGTWDISGGADPYGGNSVWARNGATYTWQFGSQPAGTYEVLMWWSGWPSRATNIPVSIYHQGGQKNVTVDQQQNTGRWNSLGQYYFDSAGAVRITAATGATVSTCADAVWFRFVSPDAPPVVETVLDNRDLRTSRTGEWGISGGSNPYGADSVWSRDGATFTWHFTPSQAGDYELSMWWTEWPSRSAGVPVDIEYLGGAHRIVVNQQQNGGQWNSLGTYPFQGGVAYSITVTSQPGPSSTCADAVRFVKSSGTNLRPSAAIRSITPNPAASGATVTFTGDGTDGDGTIQAYQWRSNIDGNLSNRSSFSTSALSVGTHTIFFKVQDNIGDWSPEVSAVLEINGSTDGVEPIFACFTYGPKDSIKTFETFLQNIGAKKEGNVWLHTRKGKSYKIHIVTDIEGMKRALYTEGAHVLVQGHSNYGLGAIFATAAETKAQVIKDIFYIDDERIFNYSSPWISVSLSGMRTGQSYPYWWPIFADGTSGIMPYTFNDPKGAPPYNYIPTYQIPGDPKHYKIETVHNGALERFPDSGKPAWYSETGATPNPSNADHRKYYITNSKSWAPSFESTGHWTEATGLPGYFKESYLVANAGTGDSTAQWKFQIDKAGSYKLYAWWPVSSLLTSRAAYTVRHASGTTPVLVNQTTNGGQWNELGEFSFGAGSYSVSLNNAVNSGNVAADAIRVAHTDNPPDVVQANFRASARYGTAPLTVEFVNQGTGDLTGRLWNFGDGQTNNTRDSITHVYTNPGTYTVTLTVSGPLGSHTKTKRDYIVVGSTTPRFQAEFSSDGSQESSVPFPVKFRNRSTGNIVQWRWDFGDGNFSNEQNPTYTYQKPGNHTVSLTVTEADGRKTTETKENFIRAVVLDNSIDNVDYPKAHYGSKTILFRKDLEVDPAKLRYKRLFFLSCNSGNYYTHTFNRGTFFYTLNTTWVAVTPGWTVYLKNYFDGKSDQELWEILQSYDPVFDYYDFSKRPSEQS